MNDKGVVWIHKSIGEMDKMDRAKIAIEFMCKNMNALNKYTKEEREELIEYFSRELRGVRKNFNQTS